MARLIVLDTGPLGLLCGAIGRPKPDRCRAWALARAEGGDVVVIPEIADYELRREMTLNRRRGLPVRSLDTLDGLCHELVYLPLTTAAMHLAAELWAEVRHHGMPTADRHALDGDAILAAQARVAGLEDDEVIIATSNVGHLERFEGITAMDWESVA